MRNGFTTAALCDLSSQSVTRSHACAACRMMHSIKSSTYENN